MLSFLWWLIIGLIAGALARLIMPGKDPMGVLATVLLGIVGSVIGGLVAGLIWRSDNSLHPGGLFLSVVGAILALWAWRMIRSRSAPAQ